MCVRARTARLAASVRVCIRERRKRKGGREQKETEKKEGEERGEVDGGVHRGPKERWGREGSWSWRKRRGREELTGPACTHHPHQLESLISPSHNTSPSISDVHIPRGKMSL